MSKSKTKEVNDSEEQYEETIKTDILTEASGLSDDTNTKVAGFLTGANYGFFASTQAMPVMKELVAGFLLVAGGVRASTGKLQGVNDTPYLSVAGLVVGLGIGIALSRPELITDYLA